MWKRIPWSTVFKALLFFVWVAVFIGTYLVLYQLHIPIRQIPTLIQHEVVEAGAYGPLFVLGVYFLQAFVPFPTTAIALLSGASFGPWLGSLIVLIGLNMTAGMSFALGRFFGRRFISKREAGWIKKYDQLLAEEGFVTVLVMRILFFPFDIVSLGCGMSQMSYRQFFMGTLLGSFPQAVVFVVAGGSFANPQSWILFSILLAGSLAMALLIRRSDWAKKRLFKPVDSVLE